jgi:hypothetical protein
MAFVFRERNYRNPRNLEKCIRFNDEEWQQIVELAKALNRPPAAIVREASLREHQRLCKSNSDLVKR